jgi:prepilin-type N-terminal cleavage/methylation domain-containing protein
MLKGLNKKRGFSFVELTIAVSIFAFLSTVTVMSYNNFNNRIGVDILAHQIAQFGHEAQVSALSVKRSVNGDFPGYGIHFEKASTTQFIFFADLNNDKIYTPGAAACGTSGAECEKVVKLLKGVTIKTLCGKADVGGITDATNCTSADGAPESSESKSGCEPSRQGVCGDIFELVLCCENQNQLCKGLHALYLVLYYRADYREIKPGLAWFYVTICLCINGVLRLSKLSLQQLFLRWWLQLPWVRSPSSTRLQERHVRCALLWITQIVQLTQWHVLFAWVFAFMVGVMLRARALEQQQIL